MMQPPPDHPAVAAAAFPPDLLAATGAVPGPVPDAGPNVMHTAEGVEPAGAQGEGDPSLGQLAPHSPSAEDAAAAAVPPAGTDGLLPLLLLPDPTFSDPAATTELRDDIDTASEGAAGEAGEAGIDIIDHVGDLPSA